MIVCRVLIGSVAGAFLYLSVIGLIEAFQQARTQSAAGIFASMIAGGCIAYLTNRQAGEPTV